MNPHIDVPWILQVAEAAGITVRPAREDALALRDLLLGPACTAGKIAALPRGRPTAT
jgi:hypothetical protein